MTDEELEARLHEAHDHRYSYPDLSGLRNRKVGVVCPDHGEFKVWLDLHLYSRSGCPSCPPRVDRNGSAQVYLVKVGMGGVLKVGCTAQSDPKRRFPSRRVEVLAAEQYDSWAEAEAREQALLADPDVAPFRNTDPKALGYDDGGYTEVLTAPVLKAVDGRIEVDRSVARMLE